MENLELKPIAAGNKNKAAVFIGTVVGIAFLGFSIYAMHLTIKSHRLTIKKLNDEGYT